MSHLSVPAKIILTMALAAAAALAAHAAEAHALPCEQFNVCQYMPRPDHNGPQLDTWNIPGYYGGWTTSPTICDPFTYKCKGRV